MNSGRIMNLLVTIPAESRRMNVGKDVIRVLGSPAYICVLQRKGLNMSERTYLSILKDEPEVLTVIETARILRIGKNKAYSLVNGGRLSSIKVGGKTIIPKMCLVVFLMDTNNYQVRP